jgi:hypothetical protein
MIFSEARFIKALPVWERGMQRELNHALKFTADVGKYTNALLRISGHTGYQVFINGEFVHYGPARAGRGYYRVDEILIEKYLTRDENTLVIIATGYFCDSFEWLKEPSFVCAEIEADREIVAYTGGTGFTACRYIEKLKKVQRYSYQRPFAEVYDFARVGNAQVPTAACEEKKFIKREISYPEFPHEPLCVIYGGGSVAFSEPERYFEDRAIVNAGGSVDGFAPSRTETISIHLAQRLKLKSEQGASRLPAYVKKNGYISQINLTLKKCQGVNIKDIIYTNTCDILGFVSIIVALDSQKTLQYFKRSFQNICTGILIGCIIYIHINPVLKLVYIVISVVVVIFGIVVL